MPWTDYLKYVYLMLSMQIHLHIYVLGCTEVYFTMLKLNNCYFRQVYFRYTSNILHLKTCILGLILRNVHCTQVLLQIKLNGNTL